MPRSPGGENNRSRYDHHADWWIWVTRQNDLDGWRLLFRKQMRHVVVHPGKAPVAYFQNAVLGYCDIRADGSFERNSTLGGHAYFKTHPEEIIVRLPSDGKAVRDGWQYTSPLDSALYTLRGAKWDNDLLQLTMSVERPDDGIQEYRMSRRIDFDASRGIVTRIVDEYESKQASNRFHARRPVQLVSVEQRSEKWMASLRAEAESCLASQVDAFALFEKATRARTKVECQAAIDQARERLKAARADSQLTEIQSVLDAALELQLADAEREVQAAEDREALFAQPPIQWEGTDFDGRGHRQIDYRGKVVLMDFWFRGCGPCIRAMPVIKKVAAHYEGKDVVVLGINVDENEQDARDVIASCGLPYPNLRGKEISTKYRVNAYPTVIVFDQTGRVADFPHSENVDELYRQITNVVDGLLNRGD